MTNLKNTTRIISVIAIMAFSFSISHAQAVKFGNIMIHLETGISLHQITSEYSFFGQPTTKTNDGALSVHLGGGLELALGKRIGIGIFGDYINYVEDPEVRDVDQEFARAVAFGPMINIYLLNKEDVTLFYTLGIGVSSLKIQNTSQYDEFNFVGRHVRTGLGFQYYFNDVIAFTGKTQFSFHNHRIDSFVAGGTEIDVDSNSWKLGHAGIQLSLGLTFKI